MLLFLYLICLYIMQYIERTFVHEESVQFGYHAEIYGTNIDISGEKNTVANRRKEQTRANGVTYSALPLKGTAEFEIEITSYQKKGSLSLGVMRIDSTGLQQEPIRVSRGFANSCIWNTGKIYNTLEISHSDNKSGSYGYGIVDLASLKKGDCIGIQLSSCNGSLSFYVNRKHQGFAAKGVYNANYDVYAIVEHTGGCTGTKITRAGTFIV